MLPEMTNMSLFHYTCRGLYAPRDKYIFDRSAALGFLHVDLKDDLSPVFSFTGFDGDVEPSVANIEDVCKSLRFYSRGCLYTALSFTMFDIRRSGRTDSEITFDEVETALKKNYRDLCNRKGSLHFNSQYVKALLDNTERITQHIQSGGEISVQ